MTEEKRTEEKEAEDVKSADKKKKKQDSEYCDTVCGMHHRLWSLQYDIPAEAV